MRKIRGLDAARRTTGAIDTIYWVAGVLLVASCARLHREPARQVPPPQAPSPEASTEPGQLIVASWYGPGFHGGRTANGERFNQNDLTAAHRSLPFGSRIHLTNPANGRSVIVRVNDRGPHRRGRTIDLSRAAARRLGIENRGTARVKMRVLDRQEAAAR